MRSYERLNLDWEKDRAAYMRQYMNTYRRRLRAREERKRARRAARLKASCARTWTLGGFCLPHFERRNELVKAEFTVAGTRMCKQCFRGRELVDPSLVVH